MNRVDCRRIRKKAEKIWELTQKIEEAKKNAPQYEQTLTFELIKYSNSLSFTEMCLIDEYIQEYLNTSKNK